MTESNVEDFNILYISLEFTCWQEARSWSYLANLGFEEGFTANDISFFTLPIFHEFAPGDPATWLSHLKAICDGKKFEQVWIEVVHNNLDDTILSYISTLAPVRLAIIGESLRYPEEVYTHAPSLKNRQADVMHRLKYMTHALVGDELDAEWLNACGIVKALWWVGALPSRAISRKASSPSQPLAYFSGALYGERRHWLQHPQLRDLLVKQQPLEEEANLPVQFDQLNQQIITQLRQTGSFNPQLLHTHIEGLRLLRRQSFTLWIEGLKQGSAVVNLPSFVLAYAGRVYEGMAAGRPVISWDIPDRPRTKALFEDGKEILLFSKDNPACLVEHITRILKKTEFAKFISSNALNKMLKFHTIEKRVAQIMTWIETGEEPDYGEYPASRAKFAGPAMSDSNLQLKIATITRNLIRESGENAINKGKIPEAIAIYSKGTHLFPDTVDFWQQLRRLAQLTGDAESVNRSNHKVFDILSNKKLKEEENSSISKHFFKQTLTIKDIPDRLDVIMPLCTGKKVLHVGCTDNPIFDPSTNLHIMLSKICRELDGLDVDVNGLDKLRQHVSGQYFTEISKVTDEYDVLLIPETIEHVDNVRDFLESLSTLSFKKCLITAPNAFLPHDNGNYWEASDVYVEHIHPDHNCWFSPYTLKNCITKFTSWRVQESYLLNNQSMVACLCDRPNIWELKNIPKKVHFYWGNDTTSFLRYLSVYSFQKLNPDWEINIYIPSENYQGDIPWGTGEGYDGTQFNGRDYSDELFSLTGITIKEVDFSAFPTINTAPENYKSDFFRWHILSTEGGLYSDIDLLYFRPMNELYFNQYDNRDVDCALCLQYAGNIIGFLLSAPHNQFFKKLFEHSISAFNTTTYQSISAPFVNQFFPSEESIRQQLPAIKFINMPMDVVYALDHDHVPSIFNDDDSDMLTDKTIGIHWYAGHPVSQYCNNILTSDNFQEFNCVLTRKIRNILNKS